MKIPSSYRYYKLEDLEKICEINNETVAKLLTDVEPIEPSEVLKIVLERNLQIPLTNEKAKSEFVVAPILGEMWFINQRFKPLSGLTFNIDASKGLKGVADFLISAKPNSSGLHSPIFCIFEAKNDAIEDWYGQCGAEMYAARIFNEREGNNIKIIYGAVTNGFTWQFLKLEGQTLFIDSQRYGTANLPQLLGAIQKIYNFYK
jgi:hypothetical protein